MQIITPVENLSSQLAELVRLYFSSETDVLLEHRIEREESFNIHIASASLDGDTGKGVFAVNSYDDPIEHKRNLLKAAKIATYDALFRLTGHSQPWGSLTGVRPTKLYADIEDDGWDAVQVFTEEYRVSEEKALLCRDINQVQRGVDIPADGYGVYIGIPFCTSRCSYCSFPGRIAKKGEMEAYLEALLLEMESRSRQLDISKCFSVYIGGGTPTSLDDGLFVKLMENVGRLYGGVDEITLEAGRPDTITHAKLVAARDAGVNRICVNPQSMVDRTLELVGRRHTAEQLEAAYYTVRDAGFNHVNMDVIAGLPGETVADFTHTMERLMALKPESFTCHTLCIKHGSKMNEFGPPETDGKEVAGMLDRAAEYAVAMGMRPYYLYRQKYAAGNLENTGYSLPGHECKYNIANMGEQTSIIAMGTGAITKLVEGDLITRNANPRDIFLYMERVKRDNEELKVNNE